MDMCMDMCIDMCMDIVYGHVYRHVYGHVHGHVHGHVYRHVYRHVFPPNPCPPRLYFASLCNCLEILMNALVPSLENIYECLQLSTNICGYR